MAETPADTSHDSSNNALHLNTLSGLDFGPSWADKGAQRRSLKSYESHGNSRAKGKRSSTGGGARDRRGVTGGSRSHAGSKDRRRQDGEHPHPDRAARKLFDATVKVDIYPQDHAFEALVNRLRSTVRTYQLFEIAHLLLEKPERYVVVVENKARPGEKPAPLFFSVPGHLPFETEAAAIEYVLDKHLDLFFDIEVIEVDPPKGNFQMVNRCSITGELIGPPNDHRYQEFLQRHYASKIRGMSFDRFVAKIETVKEQESIDAWVESMRKSARYVLKERQEGEPEVFESLQAVRLFLQQQRKDEVVGCGEKIRFAGRDIERLPQGNIRRSVQAYVEQQLHFPLDSANNIRGRLRRHKFAVYKKGSKGVSFVCAVKRKFRDSQTVFTPSIQGLIEFIEHHPNISASILPKLYIDIDTQKQHPAKLEMSEAEVAVAKQAATLAVAQAAQAAESNAEPTLETSPEPEPIPAADLSASTEARPTLELSAEEQERLKQLMLDLRWLIVEGYVTEYGDGRLFAAPPLPEATAKQIAQKTAPDEPPASDSDQRP